MSASHRDIHAVVFLTAGLMNSNVTSISLNSRRLSYDWAGHRCTIEYDDEHLARTRERFSERFVTKAPLWRVTPDTLTEYSLPSDLKASTKLGGSFLVSGVAVFWSVVPNYMPLLGPVLAILGAWCLMPLFAALGKFEGRPFQATKLVTEHGEELAAISHYSNLVQHRAIFEQQLIERVAEARRKEYAI